jgi:hypothetical protein
MKRLTKAQFEQYQNQTGLRFANKANWAHIETLSIGSWLRKNDPLQFEIEHEAANQFLNGQWQYKPWGHYAWLKAV